MSEELKQKITTFTMLVKDQFVYGGKKYALEEKRESTDLLFDIFGANWLYGTMSKYCFRFVNLQRERDLLKIACYSYLLWLKRGFFIDDKRAIPLDTNIKIKKECFGQFINKAREFVLEEYSSSILSYFKEKTNNLINKIFYILKNFATLEWKKVEEKFLLEIFSLSFIVWVRKFGHEKNHDTDTWLEKEVKNG